MKKYKQKLFCGLLVFALTCSFLSCNGNEFDGGMGGSSVRVSLGASEQSESLSESDSARIESSEEFSNSDSENFDSSTETSETDSSEEGTSNGWEDVDPPPKPGTDVLREDVDTFGHKIAYYTDGTWLDMGRVTPLDFTPKAAASRYGYTQLRLEENAAGKQNFYNQLFEAALAFEQSGGNVTAETVAGEPCYPIAKIDCSGYGISYETQQKVWRTFRQDCPEFYFISTQFCRSGDDFWLCVDGEYSTQSNRDIVRAAIQAAALECDRYLNGFMSETELALTIHDYLTSNVTYSYEADGVTPADETWAHNLVGWAMLGAGVCETYAESYAYLCDLFGLECWTVTGKDVQTGGGHAWNILQVDGVWYNVDVTWDDGFEKTAPQFIDRQWFGMGADAFAQTHQTDMPTGVALEYQAPLPTLSNTSLNPVRLQENGAWGTLLPTIDEALENLVNEGSMYEMILYPDTNAQVKSGLTIYPQGATFTKTSIPKTAGLTISAKRYRIGEFSYIPATLNAPETVVLQGDLTLIDLTWTGTKLHALDADLTLTDGVELNLDTLTATMLCVDAKTGYAVVNGKLETRQVEMLSGTLRACGKATVELLQMQKNTALYHLTAENLTVDSVISEEGAMLYMAEKNSLSVVRIGAVVARSPLTLRVDFIGLNGYPSLKLTGTIQGEINLLLGGRISEQGATAITPGMMSTPIANVLAGISTDGLHVYFIQNGVAYEYSYTKDLNGDLS